MGYDLIESKHKMQGNDLSDHILINGNNAIALGAIAGGLDFYSAYPMTPATSIMTYLAKKQVETGMVVDQAEDEIAAINFAIGASYAGARAMTGSSGGGVSLMVESFGLAGITETPIVIVDSQRPGPATGLPTRTEQSDLSFLLTASQGEFSRILISVRNAEDAFYKTVKALNLADKYQTVVILLTDQYLADSNITIPKYNLNNIENIPDAFFNPLYEKLKMYYVTGGMPEAVYMWTQERDIELVRKTLNNILEAYERDFAKHPNIYEFPKISMIWKSIPSQLSKENKKFIYKVVKEGARAREYEDALQWLVNANLVTKVFKCSAPRMPLSSYDDISAFKIYLVDVGLLTRLSQLSPNTFGEGNRLFTEFKGALTENYILQGLISQFEVTPRYWAENNYEVDFIIQNENNIIPIEVKAETNIKSRSLQKFKEKFKDDIKLRVRFSFENLKLDDDLLNIPLFMVDYTEKIINIALNKMKEKNYG